MLIGQAREHDRARRHVDTSRTWMIVAPIQRRSTVSTARGHSAPSERGVSTPELRDAYNGSLPKVTAFYTDLGQDRAAVRVIQGDRGIARVVARGCTRRSARSSTTSFAISA